MGEFQLEKRLTLDYVSENNLFVKEYNFDKSK